MTRAPYKPRRPGTLKEAVADLVYTCGGQGESARLCRVSKAQVNRYTDDSDDNAKVHMPVDIVALLEEHCGEPIVTRFLAAERNRALIELSPKRNEPAHEVLAGVAEENGRLLARAARDLANDRFDPKGAAKVKREALRAMNAIAALVEALPQGEAK